MSDPQRSAESVPEAYEPLQGSLAQTVAQELIPRLLLAHRAGAVSPAQRAEQIEQIDAADLEIYVRLVVGDDETAGERFVTALTERGVDAQAIFLDLLAPAARVLGEQWSADTCDFVAVSVALGRMQRALRVLSHGFAAIRGGTEPLVGRVLLSCVPGETHTLGLLMVAEFLVRAGWDVTVAFPGDGTDPHDLVRNETFDLVGFSVACDSSLPHLRREIAEVRRYSRNPRVGIMVGGRVFAEHPDLVARVGGDETAADASATQERALALLHRLRL